MKEMLHTVSMVKILSRIAGVYALEPLVADCVHKTCYAHTVTMDDGTQGNEI